MIGIKKIVWKKEKKAFPKWRFPGKRLAQVAVVLCCTGFVLLACYGCLLLEYSAYTSPRWDADGYYLLRTKEDFRWFTKTARGKNPSVNVRLAADIVLNDTTGWEDWPDNPPENGYAPIVHYHGHFDGNGHALEGFYAAHGNWLVFPFVILEEDARITDLTVRNSVFQTTYEDCAYEDDDGGTDVVTASALCFANYGVIENSRVQAKVTGAWDAGGIVGINYGQMTGCTFTGTVEAGADQSMKEPENRLASNTLYAGGICRSNQGNIRNCVNEGTVTLHTLSEAFHMHTYAAGGITGRVAKEGSIESSKNTGDVTSVQLAGGIAGASWGRVFQCQNEGKIHVEQAERDYWESLISAGICASNGGTVDTCLNTGAATVNQKTLTSCSPVYGVACNTINPDKGTTTNCFYLGEVTEQIYRQLGVVKFSRDEETALSEYFCGDKRWDDFIEYGFDTDPDYDPKTHKDDEDQIHLAFGPTEDVTYEVQPGDNLWSIARQFYGDGRYYGNLQWANQILEDRALVPGMELTVPHRDGILWRRYDEEGFGWAYCQLPSGERCPTRFVTSKPIDWYYGSMALDACTGLDTLWPKKPREGSVNEFGDPYEIHVFCRVDANPDGDFFAGRWLEVQDSIQKSAAAYWGNSADTFEFDHYTLDNGENVYCYSFVVYRQKDKLVCAVAYRLCDNMLVEYIGIEPLNLHWGIGQSHDVMLRVPYMAAFTDTGTKIEEARWEPESFYGRENWDFPQLHNPFALAQAYDREAKCSPYVLVTGVQ